MNATDDEWIDDYAKEADGMSSDMKIIVIVICAAVFCCCCIGVGTVGIIYMINTGKLRFAIGYKQIHQQTKSKKKKKRLENDDDSDLDDLEFSHADDKNGRLADDEQTDLDMNDADKKNKDEY